MSAVRKLHVVPAAPQSEPKPAADRHQSGIVVRHEPDWVESTLAREGIDLAQLSYRLWSPSDAGAQMPVLQDAYKFWTQGQGSLSAELGHKWTMSSDEFSRQDEWGCITYGGSCIGLSAFRWLDATLPFVPDDSYFRAWPEAARREIMSLGSTICVGSNITVAPAWRGRFGEFSVKELLLSLAIERFLASPAEVMAGTMRNGRGMNSLGYRLGARSLVSDLVHPHYGVPVDLVVFERGQRKEQEADICTGVTAHLWNQVGKKGQTYEASIG